MRNDARPVAQHSMPPFSLVVRPCARLYVKHWFYDAARGTALLPYFAHPPTIAEDSVDQPRYVMIDIVRRNDGIDPIGKRRAAVRTQLNDDHPLRVPTTPNCVHSEYRCSIDLGKGANKSLAYDVG